MNVMYDSSGEMSGYNMLFEQCVNSHTVEEVRVDIRTAKEVCVNSRTVEEVCACRMPAEICTYASDAFFERDGDCACNSNAFSDRGAASHENACIFFLFFNRILCVPVSLTWCLSLGFEGRGTVCGMQREPGSTKKRSVRRAHKDEKGVGEDLAFKKQRGTRNCIHNFDPRQTLAQALNRFLLSPMKVYIGDFRACGL